MELKDKIEVLNKQIDNISKEVDTLYKSSDIYYKKAFLFIAMGGGAFYYSIKFFNMNTATYLSLGIIFLLIACICAIFISFDITKLFIISSDIDKLKNEISNLRGENEN